MATWCDGDLPLLGCERIRWRLARLRKISSVAMIQQGLVMARLWCERDAARYYDVAVARISARRMLYVTAMRWNIVAARVRVIKGDHYCDTTSLTRARVRVCGFRRSLTNFTFLAKALALRPYCFHNCCSRFFGGRTLMHDDCTELQIRLEGPMFAFVLELLYN